MSATAVAQSAKERREQRKAFMSLFLKSPYRSGKHEISVAMLS
jgi:hypothetical protein